MCGRISARAGMNLFAPKYLLPLKTLGSGGDTLPGSRSIRHDRFRPCEKLTRRLFEQPCTIVIEPDQPTKNPLDNHEAWRQPAGPSIQHGQDEQIAQIVVSGPTTHLAGEWLMP